MRRREFAESVALAALAPLLGAGAPGLSLGPLLGTDAATDALLAAADEPSALARALAEAIRVQYGGRLQAGDLDTITKQIQASLERAAEIRKLELANGDEPDFVFTAAPPRPTT
ncbi:MAG TPA: hypothetical protein VFJ92_02860 [Gemmatimonadales bacterium]|nr:hypothetical protein [Gemmatimonadales bacterium]